MFVFTKDGPALVCDDEDCNARTDAAQAEAAGWAIARTLGPHLCPADFDVAA